MEKLIKNLKQVLSQEHDVYKEMLILAIDKKDIIIGNKIKELDSMIKTEQNLILKISKLEQIRQSIVMHMQSHLNLKGDISVTEIIKKISPKDREEINSIKNELINTINKLKEKNDLNNKLISDSLEYINLNIDLIANNDTDSTYIEEVGKGKSSERRNLFDTKA